MTIPSASSMFMDRPRKFMLLKMTKKNYALKKNNKKNS